MATFPLASRQDSSKYKRSAEDPAIKSETDGGYVVSRPKFTRAPRKKYTTGFTNLSNTERAELEAFWDTVKGGSNMFDWEDPIDGTLKTVRFTKPLSFEYAGIGGNHRWDISSIELEEV